MYVHMTTSLIMLKGTGTDEHQVHFTQYSRRPGPLRKRVSRDLGNPLCLICLYHSHSRVGVSSPPPPNFESYPLHSASDHTWHLATFEALGNTLARTRKVYFIASIYTPHLSQPRLPRLSPISAAQPLSYQLALPPPFEQSRHLSTMPRHMKGNAKGRSPAPMVSKRTSTQAFPDNHSAKRRKLNTGLASPVFHDNYEPPKLPFTWPIEPRTETCQNIMNLPAEMFEMIICATVDAVGPVDAYTKCRPVCKKFEEAMWMELYRKQPMERYTHSRAARRVLHDGLFAHMDYRVIQQKCNTVVEQLIVSVRDKILTLSSNRWERVKLQRFVSLAVHENCYKALDIVLAERASDDLADMANDVLHNALCVAIALKDEGLMLELLAEGAYLWTKTKAFLYPLNVALNLTDSHMLDLILHQDPNMLTAREQQGLADAMREHGLRCKWKFLSSTDPETGDPQSTSLRIKAIMNHVVDWCLDDMVLGSPIRLIDQLVYWTLRLGRINDFLRLIDIGKRDRDVACAARAAYFSCPPNKAALEGMLNVGFLYDRAMYTTTEPHVVEILEPYDEHYPDNDTTVLNHAIQHRDLKIAHIAMTGHSPASASGMSSPPGAKEWAYVPLRRAVQNGDEDMVRLLLACGADPEGHPFDQDNGEHCIIEHCEKVSGRDSTIWGQLVKALKLKVHTRNTAKWMHCSSFEDPCPIWYRPPDYCKQYYRRAQIRWDMQVLCPIQDHEYDFLS